VFEVNMDGTSFKARNKGRKRSGRRYPVVNSDYNKEKTEYDRAPNKWFVVHMLQYKALECRVYTFGMNTKIEIDIKVILAAIIGIILGAGGAIAAFGMDHGDRGEMGMSMEHHMMEKGDAMHGEMGMQGTMNGMTQGLTGLTGDAFDQAFITEMIAHHQGAVAMAQLALQNAKHQEVKDLAQKIITAQNAEIAQMQAWQKSWYAK
jgi:predicted outer membrane protein